MVTENAIFPNSLYHTFLTLFRLSSLSSFLICWSRLIFRCSWCISHSLALIETCSCYSLAIAEIFSMSHLSWNLISLTLLSLTLFQVCRSRRIAILSPSRPLSSWSLAVVESLSLALLPTLFSTSHTCELSTIFLGSRSPILALLLKLHY